MDRGVWRATVHRVAELDTTEVTKHAHMHVVENSHFLVLQGVRGKNAVICPPPTHRRPPSISRARSQDSCRSQWQREGPGGELDGLRSQARGHEHVYCLSHQLVPHLYTSDRTLTGLGALTSEGATPPEPCHWPTAPSPEERGHTLSRLNHCVLLSAQVHWASDSSPWRYSFPEPPTCVPDTRSRTRRLWAACAGPSGGHTHQPDSECSQ